MKEIKIIFFFKSPIEGDHIVVETSPDAVDFPRGPGTTFSYCFPAYTIVKKKTGPRHI